MSQDIEALLARARDERTAGHTGQARATYGMAATKARDSGHPGLLAHALRHICELDRKDGKSDHAMVTGREAVAIYRSMPEASPLDLANALRVTALAMEASMKPGDATSLWQEAEMLYAEAGVGEGVAECGRHLSSGL